MRHIVPTPDAVRGGARSPPGRPGLGDPPPQGFVKDRLLCSPADSSSNEIPRPGPCGPRALAPVTVTGKLHFKLIVSVLYWLRVSLRLQVLWFPCPSCLVAFKFDEYRIFLAFDHMAHLFTKSRGLLTSAPLPTVGNAFFLAKLDHLLSTRRLRLDASESREICQCRPIPSTSSAGWVASFLDFQNRAPARRETDWWCGASESGGQARARLGGHRR